MNMFALSGLLSSVTALVMALLMFWKGKQKTQIVWGFFCIAVAVWGAGVYRIATIHNASESIWWWRFAYVGVVFIPAFFTHFVYAFLNIKSRWFVILTYLVSATFCFFDITSNAFIGDVRLVFNQFYYIDQPTLLYNSFVLFFIYLVIYTHILLGKQYIIAKGIERDQLKYLFLATALGFGGGSFSYLPVYSIDLYPFLNLAIFPFSPIVAYAIFKYRLMDIRVVLRRIFIYLGLALFAYIIFYGIAWIFDRYFGGVFTKTSFITGLIIAPLFIAIFNWLNSFLHGIANKYFFVSLYSYRETVAKLTEKLNYLADLKKIADTVIDTLKTALQIDNAAIIVTDSNHKISGGNNVALRIDGFDKSLLMNAVFHSYLNSYLEKTLRILVRDEIKLITSRETISRIEKISLMQAYQEMTKSKAEVYLPLKSGDQLIGIIALGEKISGESYSREDLDLLHALALQVGIAIENALLYQEVQDFSQHLQEKVDDQTKELKNANERLKELDKLKDDFVSIASHELRTPMTVIKSYLWMALNKKKMSADLRKYLDRSRLAVDRLINLVNNMLNVSRIESGRIALQVGDVNLVELAQEVFEEVGAKAKEIKLNLKITEIPKVPVAFCDKEKIREVFLNFVSNAMKFTPPHGTITISFEIQEPFVKISVTDTGNGIAPEDLKKLFTKFGKIQNSYSGMAEARGTGLGLYIAKSIISLHHGTVDVKSEGLGKGTTFTFSLPLVETDVAHQVAEDAKKSETADAKTLISTHETKQPKP